MTKTAAVRGGFVLAAAAMLSVALATAANGQWLERDGSEAAVAVPESMAQVQLSFAPLVQVASPAVVNVFTSVFVGGGPGSRLYDDPFFREFFGDRRRQGPSVAPRPNQSGGGQREEPLSLGSGVLLSPDGIIVTNNHVIEGADAITVILADRREFVAELVGTDPDTDLAVLRIAVPDESLIYLDLGNSDAVAVGDLVLAIGNPFGVGQTVTSGIISALARTDVGVADYSFFIQTDAPINPGNSGGALVTMDGRLIGVNSAIYSQSGGSHGIGFAIPANMVERVVTALLEGGTVMRPWLGVATEDVTSAMASEIGLDRPYGALVVDVAPDSPADEVGLLTGDVVLSVNGNELENGEALRFRIGTLAADEEVRLEIMRDGRRIPMVAVLTLPPSSQMAADAVPLTGRNPLAGSAVVELTRDLMNEYDLGRMRGGALVVAVQTGSPAEEIGLSVGDIVVGINSREISDIDGLTQILSQPQPLWRISVLRDGELLSVTVRG